MIQSRFQQHTHGSWIAVYLFKKISPFQIAHAARKQSDVPTFTLHPTFTSDRVVRMNEHHVHNYIIHVHVHVHWFANRVSYILVHFTAYFLPVPTVEKYPTGITGKYRVSSEYLTPP